MGRWGCLVPDSHFLNPTSRIPNPTWYEERINSGHLSSDLHMSKCRTPHVPTQYISKCDLNFLKLLHKPRQSYEYQTCTAICLVFIHFSVPAEDQTLLLCTQTLGRLCLFVITKKENKDLCGSIRSPSTNTCVSLGAVDTILKNCPSRLMPETTD